MKGKNKLLLSLLSIPSILIPATAVVACDKKTTKDNENQDKPKTVSFNSKQLKTILETLRYSGLKEGEFKSKEIKRTPIKENDQILTGFGLYVPKELSKLISSSETKYPWTIYYSKSANSETIKYEYESPDRAIQGEKYVDVTNFVGDDSTVKDIQGYYNLLKSTKYSLEEFTRVKKTINLNNVPVYHSDLSELRILSFRELSLRLAEKEKDGYSIFVLSGTNEVQKLQMGIVKKLANGYKTISKFMLSLKWFDNKLQF